MALVNRKKYQREWRRKNIKHCAQAQKQWRLNNPERWKEICKGVGQRYREKIKSLPPDARNAYRKHYAERRRLWKKENIHAKLSDVLRSRLRYAVAGHKKSGATLDLLGCSPARLKLHLEARFKPDMSWANYGDWHIDHIKPCAKFDLSKPEEQRACFHYTNLQPLWASENIAKGGR